MLEAMISLDTVDVMALVLWCCMKYPPGFLRSAFKSLRFAPQEASMATKARDDHLCRAWKLFMLAPRMLLFRRSRGGLIPKNTLLERFAQFGREKWGTLLIQSRDAAEEDAVARGRVERRAEKAQTLVALRSRSSGRCSGGSREPSHVELVKRRV